jgi:hypothetical protein
LPAEGVNELGHLTQALEIEEMSSGSQRKGSRGGAGVISRAEGNGGMAAIRQTHDDVGALATADADDGQSLPAKRMLGMRDRHES